MSRLALLVALLVALAAPAAALADADGPGLISSPSSPLPRIAIWEDLRCEADSAHLPIGRVFHADSACATMASVDGVLYGSTQIPGYSGAFQPLPFTPVSQSRAVGGGAAVDATQITTEVALGNTGVHLTQTDSYAGYADNWRTDVTVSNVGAETHFVVLYRVGDCASGEQDGGWVTTPGFQPAIQQSIGCRAINDGENAFQRVSLYPFPTYDSRGDENLTSSIWNSIASGTQLPSFCCAQSGDQALALSFPISVAPGHTVQRTTIFRVTDDSAEEISVGHLYPDAQDVEVGHEIGYHVSVGSYVIDGPAGQLREIVVRLPAGSVYVPHSTTGEITSEPMVNGDTLSWQTDLTAYDGQYHEFSFRFLAPQIAGTYAGRVWAATSPGYLVPVDEGWFNVNNPDSGDPPDTLITVGPPIVGYDHSPVVRFTSNPPGAHFQCTLSRTGDPFGPAAPCTSPDTLGPLADGSYTFTVAAVDRFGRVDPSSAMAKFTIIEPPAGSAPDTAIDDGPTGLTNNRTPTFVVRASDSTARLECRVVGDPAQSTFTPCAATTRVGTLADADYRFEARAVSAAGIPDPTPAARAFTVDATAPDTVFGPLPPGVLPGPRGTSVATTRMALRADNSTALRVACSAAAPCAGTLTLSTRSALVARSDYALRAGTSATLKLGLPTAVGDRVQRTGAVALWAATGAGAPRALTLRADPRAPRLLDAGTSVPVTGVPKVPGTAGTVVVRVACPRGAVCVGRLELRSVPAVSGASHALATPVAIRRGGRVRLRVHGLGGLRAVPAVLRFRDARGVTRARADLILETETTDR